MFKRTIMATSVALAITALPAVAQEEEGSFLDEWEIAGELKNESATFTESGQGIGATTTWNQASDTHGKDVYKSESTARIFVNGDVGEESTFHAELNLRYDHEATPNKYKDYEEYSQHDYLRELYVDTSVADGDVSLRAGKQQVVWGTADGIKLLDIINPTDWREFAQNTMEDSRIPVWMLNAEVDLDGGENIQAILSQSEANKIPGLSVASGKGTSHSNGDQGHPFLMKGVDLMTGQVNGFMNVAPALGATAKVFDRVAIGFGYTSLSGQTGTRVVDFVAGSANTGFEAICTDGVNHAGGDASCLANAAHNALLDNSATWGAGANNQNAQNLLDTSGDEAKWDTNNPNSAFEYMWETTFATFDNFVDMTSEYRVDHSDIPNVGLRLKGSTDSGLNYSVNGFVGNDPNPYVEVSWEKQDGTKLVEKRSANTGNFSGGTDVTLLLVSNSSDTTSAVGAQLTPSTNGASSADRANLVLTEKTQRINNLGASFDTSVESEILGPVVFRGEFLYQQNVRNPVITRKASNGVDLNHGFFASSMKMEKGDMFKYVLGADINVLTNMMLSGQVIQMRNLDYVDVGDKDSSDWRYTADMATMSMSNNMNKAEENKEFYSFFMSKPFGNEQQHRWNNIFMYEENGGKWNRLDVEYSFSDEIIGTAELNSYWGDVNTQFGQMEKSSNAQLGLKYIF